MLHRRLVAAKEPATQHAERERATATAAAPVAAAPMAAAHRNRMDEAKRVLEAAARKTGKVPSRASRFEAEEVEALESHE